MKRSQINYAIDKAHAIAETFRICLPEFAGFTADFWSQKRAEEWQEVRDLQLGWDITDFGSGCFNETGLTLLTLRNGALSDARYPKPYAEKMLQIQQDQQTPWHFHYHKMEDILNRGGGHLCMQLAWATEEEQLDAQRSVSVAVDGCQRTLKPGDTLVLKPGQGVCLPPMLYHRFWAENALVMGWEISMVNDDKRDNRFLEASGRFPIIQEDEPIKWLLCSEYPR
ncbi:D-lyxose/D-mannose family sugar isomerase [Klebsiella sp. RHBSTW-00215]|uniref:D-lyxose/D-mannose family sugar isomerase n=1 Tax=Klebsiella sp. RHBSTW-00215 TaxID=2742640 RepID=UPI0015F3BB6E|nr:D-lyxose/D-mannose family sugar isomerase [Klebsiella sp. RHBSTW-00215]MBA7930892.1 D-lyxose/D-mannose family sugar isomerase [Klebsiella sp. RHBSTW-00215]